MTPSSCLKEASCSSSTMMRPRSGKGRNSAERAPTTSATWPSATPRQVSRRSAWPRSECHCAGAALERGGNGCEIDLGLARAGDAVEQRHRESALPHLGDELVGGDVLCGRKS